MSEGMETAQESDRNTLSEVGDSGFGLSQSGQTSVSRCRICLEASISRELIAPCYCAGTIGLVHKDCLEKWLNLSKSHRCEICSYEFKVDTQFPSLKKWCLEGGRGESQIRRRHLWTDCICLLIMLPLMVLCAWLTAASGKSSGHSSEFSWQAFSLGLLFAVLFSIFIVWLMFSIRYHRQSWKMWRHNNQLITLRDSAGREGMDPAHTFVCEPLDQTVGSFTGTRGSEIPTVLSLPTELELKQVESPRTLIKQYSSPVLSFTMRPNAASDEVTITNGGYPATLDASALARSLSVHSTGVQTMPHALNFAQGFSELPSCQRAGNALHPQGDGLVIT